MATISRVAAKTMSAVLALAILTVGFIITAQTAYAADEHTLTYTKGELTWTDTPVDKNGAAILNLFSNAYMNVNSGTAEKLVAPGTSGETTIRLKNAVKGKVAYTAVLYHQKTNEDLPVITELDAGAEADETGAFDLPEGVSPARLSAQYRVRWKAEKHRNWQSVGAGPLTGILHAIRRWATNRSRTNIWSGYMSLSRMETPIRRQAEARSRAVAANCLSWVC